MLIISQPSTAALPHSSHRFRLCTLPPDLLSVLLSLPPTQLSSTPNLSLLISLPLYFSLSPSSLSPSSLSPLFPSLPSLSPPVSPSPHSLLLSRRPLTLPSLPPPSIPPTHTPPHHSGTLPWPLYREAVCRAGEVRRTQRTQ